MRLLILAGLLVAVACPATAATIDVSPYVKQDSFEAIKLSPNGDYYAAVVPLEEKSILLIVHRSDNKPTGRVDMGKNNFIGGFWWVSPQRLIVRGAHKFGALDQPQLSGNLYGIDADGGNALTLAGPEVTQMSTGSHIQGRVAESAAADLVDGLDGDDKYALVAMSPFDTDAYSRVDRMDVETGKRTQVVRAPVRNAWFMADHQGVVRFAVGFDTNDVHQVFYRTGNGADWKQINNGLSSGHDEWPLGFSADDRNAYLQVNQATGPDAIEQMDSVSGARKQIFRDAFADPGEVIYVNRAPVGVEVMSATPHTVFFDPAGSDARLVHSLEAAFPGNTVNVTSQTTDGKLALFEVASDRNPGDVYVFDTVAKKADHLLSRRDWLDPEAMASVQPFDFKARDGMKLYGYVTTPRGAATNLPMVVIPHGGPFGVADDWGFDPETQMLAAAGYAVLQVNYRGSGNHGMDYRRAGMRQWGGSMQDDVTDATRWAISKGIADSNRVCIYGGSYGAYSALMGVAKEPALYKCAVGYVGVYDLPMMYSKGDTMQSYSGKAFLREWIGDPSQLGAVSPTNLASHIKVPVLLVAGGQDQRAPIAHSQEMEKALRAAGAPVETLYVRTEGHGFFIEEHRKQFYSQLLAFLDKNIGSGSATTSGGAGAAPVSSGH